MGTKIQVCWKFFILSIHNFFFLGYQVTSKIFGHSLPTTKRNFLQMFEFLSFQMIRLNRDEETWFVFVAVIWVFLFQDGTKKNVSSHYYMNMYSFQHKWYYVHKKKKKNLFRLIPGTLQHVYCQNHIKQSVITLYTYLFFSWLTWESASILKTCQKP